MAKVALSYGHGCDTYELKHSKFVVVGGQVYEEHTHNWQVGVRVKAHLLRHGVQVLEVQPPNGHDVPLQERTNKANAWGADLYWSIHSNSGPSSAQGWCAFYWASNSAQKGKAVADLYVKHVKEIGLPLYHGGEWGSIRGTWNDFHELRETNMIAVLTENGFMTNASDFKKIFLNEGGHWDKLAEAHAKAILEHFGIAYKAPAPPKAPAPVKTTGDGKTFYRVVTGSFSDKGNASDRAAALKKKGFDSFLDAFQKDGKTFFRVVTGSFGDKDNAQAQSDKIKKAGFDSFLDVYKK